MTRTLVWLTALFVVAAAVAMAEQTSTERAKELGLVLTAAPPLRQLAYSGVLGDIYAHNDKAENWDRGLTLAHEGTHGANNVIRNRYGGDVRCNAMYVCNNQAIVIGEPGVPLDLVARYLPRNMRGVTYNTYFVGSLSDWRYQTLYLFDEWSSYVNATWAGLQRGQIRSSDSLQMAEFTVYAFVAVAATADNKPDYDLTQMRGAVAWMCEMRVMPLLRKRGAEAGARHWEIFRTSSETAQLRQFVRDYFGEAWTEEVLEF